LFCRVLFYYCKWVVAAMLSWAGLPSSVFLLQMGCCCYVELGCVLLCSVAVPLMFAAAILRWAALL
ncbi:unnamed protein product, partial [Ilex paraguariensis]